MATYDEVIASAETENELPQGTEAVEEHASESTMTVRDAVAQAFAKHSGEGETEQPDAKPKTALPTSTAVDIGEGKTVDTVTGHVSEPLRAPAGWTPLLREKWSTLDPSVQKFIHERELDHTRTITKTAEDRKLASEMKEVFSPYESTLRQYNESGASLTKKMVEQWNALMTGSPVLKAEIIAGWINHTRPDAQALQQYLGGQKPSQPQIEQRAPDVSELVKAEIAKRDEMQAMSAATREVEQFAADPKNEFFHDVRDNMKRIIEAQVFDAPDLPTLFKKAYDLACSQHPEISQILARRAPVAPAAPKAKPVGQVKPSLNNGNRNKVPAKVMSTREAVAKAWAELAS